MNSNTMNEAIMQEQIQINEKFFKRKTIFICVIYTVLAILGTANSLFAGINFIFCIYVVFANHNKVLVPFLVYATFFASIFKILQITQMSMFTLIMLAYIAKLFLATINKIDSYFLIFFIFTAFTLIIQFMQENVDINRNIKFYSNLLYMYFISKEIDYTGDDHEKVDSKNVLYAFLFGVLISSLTRFLDGPVFDIESIVGEISSTLEIGTEAYIRFSGLYADPNYYAVNLILALVILCYLFSRRKISIIPLTALFSLFVVFSIMTRSKSALIMLPIVLFTLIFASEKRKNIFLTLFLAIGAVVIIYLVLSNKITWFEIIMKRFEQDKNLNDLTTGRAQLWSMYLEYLFSNPIKLFFGTGISAPLLMQRGAHNTYIDILYHLGIVGASLFVILIKKIIIKNISFKRDINCYGPLIVVAIMYFFISSLFDIDFSTNILLITIVFNTYHASSQGTPDSNHNHSYN